jgi:hypothetical protein
MSVKKAAICFLSPNTLPCVQAKKLQEIRMGKMRPNMGLFRRILPVSWKKEYLAT